MQLWLTSLHQSLNPFDVLYKSVQESSAQMNITVRSNKSIIEIDYKRNISF